MAGEDSACTRFIPVAVNNTPWPIEAYRRGLFWLMAPEGQMFFMAGRHDSKQQACWMEREAEISHQSKLEVAWGLKLSKPLPSDMLPPG